MIVRILGEGRYELPETDLPAIEKLDARLLDALDRGDGATFSATLADIISEVRRRGSLLAPEDLRTSGRVVPHEGSTLSEVKELLAEGG